MKQPSFRSLTRSLACAATLLLLLGFMGVLGPAARVADAAGGMGNPEAAPGGTYQTGDTPPVVAQNPIDLVIYSSRGVTFVSTASGTPAPTEQWPWSKSPTRFHPNPPRG